MAHASRPVFDGIEQVHPDELPALRAAGVVVVDIRESFEREQDAMPDTIHRPMSRFLEWADEFPPEQELVLQCRSGQRSQHIAQVMAQRGYARVHNLAGGILDWHAADEP